MIKKLVIPFILALCLTGCKNEPENKTVEDEKAQVSAKFDSILNNYYEDGLKLNPISATTSGDMR
ncbi:MAG TPA: hypothetical protein VJ973_02730, partial [Christiangramia sp.]|nr:hypothetical protein [Christiangramia sp.]